MKYEIINQEEAKRITGWTTNMEQEYKGILPGYLCGYNFEVVTRDGRTDFCSMTSSYLPPSETMRGGYAMFLKDVDLTPTGRVIFRGYYEEEYDPIERESYLIPIDPFKN